MIIRRVERNEIEEEIIRQVAERVRHKNAAYIAEENILEYRHGDRWSHVDSSGSADNVGQFIAHSAELTVALQRVRDNDVEVVDEFIEAMSEEMHKQFAQSLFDMVGRAAESVGNTVHVERQNEARGIEPQTDVEMQEGLRSMFQKMELGINRHGAVSYPSLFIHPSNKRMIAFINAPKDPAFEAEMEELNGRKELDAIAKEAARQSRFRRT
jgi:hypothetical protein